MFDVDDERSKPIARRRRFASCASLVDTASAARSD
jgi:hypothetical protein